jgi:hypothetical protein
LIVSEEPIKNKDNSEFDALVLTDTLILTILLLDLFQNSLAEVIALYEQTALVLKQLLLDLVQVVDIEDLLALVLELGELRIDLVRDQVQIVDVGALDVHELLDEAITYLVHLADLNVREYAVTVDQQALSLILDLANQVVVVVDD